MNAVEKSDLVNAKAKHYLFKVKMRAYLDGSTEVAEEILADHRLCGLGKWIADVGGPKYSSFKEISELDTIHQQIHETAKVIIDLKKKGFLEDAKAKMAEINTIGNLIINKIETLETLLQTRNL